MSISEEMALVLKHYSLIDTLDVPDTFKVLCPLHADINASMQINLQEGRFFCYGCQQKGDAIGLIQGIEGLNAMSAWSKYIKIIKGSDVEKVNIQKTKRKSSKQLRKEAQLYFYSLSKPSWGYIKNSYMHKRGFNSKVLSKVDARINPNNAYPIIFPMIDMGVFKGYVGRTTDKEIEKKRKYLYNKGFTRRNTLVGDYSNPWPIITEGYMDWMKFKQFGIDNCCAILGWKITDTQLEKLKKYTTTVISALDATDTGRQGTKILKEHFTVVNYAFPEFIKDPGDLDVYEHRLAWDKTLSRVKKHDPDIKKSNWRIL